MRFFFLLISVLMFLTSCNNECRDTSGYAFEIPASLSPAKRIYNIGDTITVSSMFSNRVYDSTNNQEFLLENYLFYPSIGFERLDTTGIDTIELVTSKHFDFVIESDFDLEVFETSDGSVIDGQYNNSGDEYELEYKIVCKHKGLFLKSFSSRLFFRGSDQEFPGKCRLVDANNPVTILNDGADNNADLLLEAVDPGWHLLYNNRLDRGFHDLGGYCFKVE
jgi:hypothetical protein